MISRRHEDTSRGLKLGIAEGKRRQRWQKVYHASPSGLSKGLDKGGPKPYKGKMIAEHTKKQTNWIHLNSDLEESHQLPSRNKRRFPWNQAFREHSYISLKKANWAQVLLTTANST